MLYSGLTGVLWLFLGAMAWAQGQKLVIGVGDHEYLPHYTFIKNEYGGFGRDLLDAFAGSQGYIFEYRALPKKRLLMEYFTGQIDLIYPDNAKWASAARIGHEIKYSSNVVAYIDGAMVLPAKKGTIKFDALRSIGTIRGFTLWEYMDRIKSGSLILEETNSFVGLLEMTLNNRTQASYLNIAVADYYLTKVLGKPNELVFDEALPHTKDNYHLSTIKRPEVILEFNNFLVANKKTVMELKNKYQLR